MTVDKQEVPVSVDRPASTGARQVDGQKRLESLLLDDADCMQAVEQIADQEVKVVGDGKKSRFGSLVALSLFCILLLVAGYYFLKNMSVPQPPVNQPSHYVSPKFSIPDRLKIASATADGVIVEKIPVSELNPVVAKKTDLKQDTYVAPPAIATKVPLFTVSVGPFINDEELQQAISRLQELGFQSQERPGRGQVSMIRLLEGVYPAAEAKIHLAALKKVVNSAFLLPDGDKLALYAGSFHQESRARQMQGDLVHEMINVSLINSEVIMDGTMLVALQADQKTAREVVVHISGFGLHTQMVEIK